MLRLRITPLLLFLSQCAGGPSTEVHTGSHYYTHVDGESGVTLQCERCPPGQHLLRHCSAHQRTQCAPCPQHHYTQFWNYVSRCLYCSNMCAEEHQRVKHECAPQRNRVCECAPGYYLLNDACRRHAPCPKGQGVTSPGTPDKDTKCDRCPHGYFSSVSSASAACQPLTNCTSLGQVTVVRGTHTRDAMCATCQDLSSNSGIAVLRYMVSDVFQQEEITEKKLIRLVRRLPHPDGEMNRGDPKACVSTWVSNMGLETLKVLPKKLRRCHLHRLAELLRRRIKSFASLPTCKGTDGE